MAYVPKVKRRALRFAPCGPTMVGDCNMWERVMVKALPKAAERLLGICLGLPGAELEETRRGPTYRVNGKIFALERRREGDNTVWCKLPRNAQAGLLAASPRRYFSPPFYGTKGWIGVILDDATDWSEIEALVRQSHGLVVSGQP